MNHPQQQDKQGGQGFSELMMIGLEYHYHTETDDRLQPHGISPSGKSAMPFDRGTMAANARKRLFNAISEGSLRGYSQDDVIKAIQKAAEFEYPEICRILGRTEFSL